MVFQTVVPLNRDLAHYNKAPESTDLRKSRAEYLREIIGSNMKIEMSSNRPIAVTISAPLIVRRSSR